MLAKVVDCHGDLARLRAVPPLEVLRRRCLRSLPAPLEVAECRRVEKEKNSEKSVVTMGSGPLAVVGSELSRVARLVASWQLAAADGHVVLFTRQAESNQASAHPC